MKGSALDSIRFLSFRFLYGNGNADKKVIKPYSINCNPFSRAMVSPLSTKNPMPGGLISNRPASSLSDILNSLAALSAVPAQAGQKQKRLLAFTFRCCLPLGNISCGSIPVDFGDPFGNPIVIQGKRNHNICDVRLDYGTEVLEDYRAE